MNTKPINTIRDGSLKATIWRNPSEKGDYYSVQILRTWRDDSGTYFDSDAFTGTQLLRVARLANIAYSEIVAYMQNDLKGGKSS